MIQINPKNLIKHNHYFIEFFDDEVSERYQGVFLGKLKMYEYGKREYIGSSSSRREEINDKSVEIGYLFEMSPIKKLTNMSDVAPWNIQLNTTAPQLMILDYDGESMRFYNNTKVNPNTTKITEMFPNGVSNHISSFIKGGRKTKKKR